MNQLSPFIVISGPYEVRQQKSAGVLERLLQIIEEDF